MVNIAQVYSYICKNYYLTFFLLQSCLPAGRLFPLLNKNRHQFVVFRLQRHHNRDITREHSLENNPNVTSMCELYCIFPTSLMGSLQLLEYIISVPLSATEKCHFWCYMQMLFTCTKKSGSKMNAQDLPHPIDSPPYMSHSHKRRGSASRPDATTP